METKQTSELFDAPPPAKRAYNRKPTTATDTTMQPELIPAPIHMRHPVQMLPATTPTPASLIEMAISQPDFAIEKLERLLALHERWEANQSRKEFFEALSTFQSIVPVITKNKGADYGQGKTKYMYATLDAIIAQIQKPMATCGLSYRWEFKEEAQTIIVSCIITHRGGHHETTTMSGVADTSGSKNAIQSRGSTLTYLQRYTLIGALGIGTAQEDTDAHGTPDDDLRDVAEQLQLLNGVEELVRYYEQPGMRALHGNPKFQQLFTERKKQLITPKK